MLKDEIQRSLLLSGSAVWNRFVEYFERMLSADDVGKGGHCLHVENVFLKEGNVAGNAIEESERLNK